jgi:predicted 3-demethylubiquinone-9 3-methyltransferase (glyoxalase superfamily)
MEPLTKISNKLKFKGNPRQITGKQFELLKAHISELGDLSGVIYCHNNKAYVGGNQRSEVFHEAKIEIVERFKKPTINKTVAHGFILFNGEKFAYREVAFTKEEFEKACIVANNDGGKWDFDMLANEFDESLLLEWGMDIPDTSISEEPDNKTFTANFEIKVTCKSEEELNDLYHELAGRGFDLEVVGAKA